MTGRSDKEMPFLEHLEEFRHVILSSLAALFLCSILGYVFSGRVLDYIVVRSVGEAQFLRPMEAFNVRFKIALILGAVVSLPYIAFQIWTFVVPGLLHNERKLVLPLVAWSTLLFMGGMAFAYWILTPLMLRLLLDFGTAHVKANIAVDYLLDFILKLALGTGIMFQLPLVVVILTMVRVVSPAFLWSKWRHAIVVILIVASVVTPGDGALSTLVLAGPILVLYFTSAILSTLIVRARRRKEAREGVQEERNGVRGERDGVQGEQDGVRGERDSVQGERGERMSSVRGGSEEDAQAVTESGGTDGSPAGEALSETERLEKVAEAEKRRKERLALALEAKRKAAEEVDDEQLADEDFQAEMGIEREGEGEAGAAEAGPDDVPADELGAGETGAEEPGVSGAGAEERGADDAGADEPVAGDAGADETGAGPPPPRKLGREDREFPPEGTVPRRPRRPKPGPPEAGQGS